jgi:hypothetical protein
MEPVQYPKVTIAGEVYELRFGFLAQYVLDKMRVDVRNLKGLLLGEGAGKMALFIDMFAACAAHQFEANGEPYPSPAHWATVIKPEDFKAVCQGVLAALEKNAQSSAIVTTDQPTMKQ